MPKSVKPLPLRKSDNDKWEVENVPGNWIKCENEADAKIISNVPIVRAKIYKTIFPNNALSNELDKTAEKLKQYRISDYRFFKAMAEKARGQGS